MTGTAQDIVRRTGRRLGADPARVITKLFVPGQSSFDHQDSRAGAVLRRVLGLPEAEVERLVADLSARFSSRHRDLDAAFDRHAAELSDRLGRVDLSPARRWLLGATFTSEYAVEAAALCNPSIVAHPDQSGVDDGSLRFVMSLRCIGEGHRSSIGFATGQIVGDGDIELDPRPPFTTTGSHHRLELHRIVFRQELDRLGARTESADHVLDALGDRFSATDLDAELARLESHLATWSTGERTIALLRMIAGRSYAVHFGEEVPLDERLLYPAMAAESHGMEDARFVRFIDEGGTATYCATYTAYDGGEIVQQLLETDDFRHFSSSPLVGPAAANKGLALFPRRIGGRYAALSRADRETNSVAFSDDFHAWGASLPCQSPSHPWEILHLGNCGSPIETDAGWLVLTHGVGPMRTYSLGAVLLDLEDPTRVLGQLRDPLLSPTPDEQDGYVPNVVYSCGSLTHSGNLVVPYGIGDAAIGFATVDLRGLLDLLTRARPLGLR